MFFYQYLQQIFLFWHCAVIFLIAISMHLELLSVKKDSYPKSCPWRVLYLHISIMWPNPNLIIYPSPTPTSTLCPWNGVARCKCLLDVILRQKEIHRCLSQTYTKIICIWTSKNITRFRLENVWAFVFPQVDSEHTRLVDQHETISTVRLHRVQLIMDVSTSKQWVDSRRVVKEEQIPCRWIHSISCQKWKTGLLFLTRFSVKSPAGNRKTLNTAHDFGNTFTTWQLQF